MYKVVPLKVGEFLDFPKAKLIYGDKSGAGELTPMTAFLLLGPKRKILVDTGTCGEEHGKKYHFNIRRTPEMEVQNILQAMGIPPEEISDIILTHLHWDHCYNLEHFPGAKIYVQQKELLAAMNPLPVHRVMYEHPKAGFTLPWMHALAQMEFVDGDTDLFPGIRLIHIPGHSAGSQGVVVQGEENTYILAGDLISADENWSGIPGHRHIPCGTVDSLGEYYASFAKLESYPGAVVLPSHDNKVFAQSEYR